MDIKQLWLNAQTSGAPSINTLLQSGLALMLLWSRCCSDAWRAISSCTPAACSAATGAALAQRPAPQQGVPPPGADDAVAGDPVRPAPGAGTEQDRHAFLGNVALAFTILFLVLAISALLNALLDIYARTEHAAPARSRAMCNWRRWCCTCSARSSSSPP
jgi:hypothetical protein